MLTDMTLGQYYPGHSYLHQMDPRAKILCTMIFIVAIFLANNLYSYVVVAGFTFLAIALSGVPAKMIWKAIKPLWVVLVFTMLIHILTTPGTEIFSWKFIHISEEGIRNGIVMTLRLVFLIAFSSLLTYTTSPIVLTDGIEDLLMPFRRFGVPAHELAMMMTIALRFIPTLLEETDRIMKAQSSRGADFVNGNLWQRAKNMIRPSSRSSSPPSAAPTTSRPPWKPAAIAAAKDVPRCTSSPIHGGIEMPSSPLPS